MKQSILKKAVLVTATALSFACSAAASTESPDVSRVRREVAAAETVSGEMPMSRIPAQAMRCEFAAIDAEIESRHSQERTGSTGSRAAHLE